MGLSPEFGTGDNNICTNLGFSFQHNIQLEDGTLIFLINGNISQVVLEDQNPTTRIRRIRVVDDSFVRQFGNMNLQIYLEEGWGVCSF